MWTMMAMGTVLACPRRAFWTAVCRAVRAHAANQTTADSFRTIWGRLPCHRRGSTTAPARQRAPPALCLLRPSCTTTGTRRLDQRGVSHACTGRTRALHQWSKLHKIVSVVGCGPVMLEDRREARRWQELAREDRSRCFARHHGLSDWSSLVQLRFLLMAHTKYMWRAPTTHWGQAQKKSCHLPCSVVSICRDTEDGKYCTAQRLSRRRSTVVAPARLIHWYCHNRRHCWRRGASDRRYPSHPRTTLGGRFTTRMPERCWRLLLTPTSEKPV